MEKFKNLQTAEEVQKKLIELKEIYDSEKQFLFEEYKRLSSIKPGDKVSVTDYRGKTEIGGCVDFEIKYNNHILPIVHSLKKDGTISLVGRLFIYHDSVVKKIE